MLCTWIGGRAVEREIGQVEVVTRFGSRFGKPRIKSAAGYSGSLSAIMSIFSICGSENNTPVLGPSA